MTEFICFDLSETNDVNSISLPISMKTFRLQNLEAPLLGTAALVLKCVNMFDNDMGLLMCGHIFWQSWFIVSSVVIYKILRIQK